jgi:hypothetical protein
MDQATKPGNPSSVCKVMKFSSTTFDCDQHSMAPCPEALG